MIPKSPNNGFVAGGPQDFSAGEKTRFEPRSFFGESFEITDHRLEFMLFPWPHPLQGGLSLSGFPFDIGVNVSRIIINYAEFSPPLDVLVYVLVCLAGGCFPRRCNPIHVNPIILSPPRQLPILLPRPPSGDFSKQLCDPCAHGELEIGQGRSEWMETSSGRIFIMEVEDDDDARETR